MTSSNEQCDLVLPGYTFSDRLGEGGYGVVWRAEAPGGLNKAVKIVFGNYQDKRAVSELRALERIKEVRHPFLLSLERIEVVDGQLIIVTELAEGSLKDRFDQCIAEGLPGIPRDELLGYMRDAADALDFLSDQHHLQHLDVKPENLLLVGGHVKVADFGLVKDVQNTQASLVGGLTPLYSAPEVFKGSPGTQSDQYSLAVLYQEMLTNARPFPGITAAELTLQHLHDEPNLLELPASDSYTVARALSKNPQQRFSSCSELVESLLGQPNAAPGESSQGAESTVDKPVVRFSPPTPAKRPQSDVSVTQVVDFEPGSDSACVSDSMRFEAPQLKSDQVTTLPALDTPTDSFQPTPVLVIGIGGTARSVLQHYQGMLNKQFGQASDVPAIQTLLLDTDANTLRSATQADSENALQPEQTLSLSLRRPQEYREQSGALLQWLSRRWLYNIPRSLQTEGLRPLGRLALVDHGQQTFQRIRMALRKSVDPESIETSSAKTPLRFRSETVRVYVVASIAGGTGSGTSLDVGYAVRHVLAKLGIPEAKTVGLLAYSGGRDSQQGSLAKVNACSWLTEWNHYKHSAGGYPGDAALGLPAFESGTPAFDSTYLVHLGEGLEPTQFEESTKAMADYLFLDTLSPVQMLLDANRNESTSQEPSSAILRTFGLCQQSAAPRGVIEHLTAKLCHGVVLGWTGEAATLAQNTPQSVTDVLSQGLQDSKTKTSSPSDTSQQVRGAAQLISKLQLGLEQVAVTARTLILEKFGGNVEALLQKLIHNSTTAGQPPSLTEMIRVVDNLFSPPDEAADSEQPDKPHVLGQPLRTIISPLGMKLAGDLRQWVLQKLDDPTERLSGARRATGWFSDHMQATSDNARCLSEGIAQKLAEVKSKASGPPLTKDIRSKQEQIAATLEGILQYFRHRLDQSALQAADDLARMLHAELKTTSEALTEFGRHLSHLAESFAHANADSKHLPCDEEGLALAQEVSSQLASHFSELTTQLDLQLQTENIDVQGGLFATLMSRGKVFDAVMAQLERNATSLVDQTIRELNYSATEDFETGMLSLANPFAKAQPNLLQHGGQQRHIACLPQASWTAEQLTQLAKKLGPDAALIEGAGDTLALCCEASGLPVANVAAELIQCRRDYADFANRVHTRSDIQWTPLVNTVENETDTPSQDSESFSTQVL